MCSRLERSERHTRKQLTHEKAQQMLLLFDPVGEKRKCETNCNEKPTVNEIRTESVLLAIFDENIDTHEKCIFFVRWNWTGWYDVSNSFWGIF